MKEIDRTLTFQHDFAEDRRIPVHGATVPTTVTELVLTLFDALSSTAADADHHVRVVTAQLTLLAD